MSPARIPEGDLIDELQRLADEFDQTPTQPLMSRHGNHSASTYKYRFGSWNEAIERAGLEPNIRGVTNWYTDEDLLDAIRELSDELGHTPTQREMREQGEHGVSTYYERFESWVAAVEEAGLEPRHAGAIPNGTLLTTLQELAVELERTPEYEDVATHTNIDPENYLNRWESWWIACSMAGVTQADLAGVFDAETEEEVA